VSTVNINSLRLFSFAMKACSMATIAILNKVEHSAPHAAPNNSHRSRQQVMTAYHSMAWARHWALSTAARARACCAFFWLVACWWRRRFAQTMRMPLCHLPFGSVAECESQLLHAHAAASTECVHDWVLSTPLMGVGPVLGLMCLSANIHHSRSTRQLPPA
jgi:hypothetical protein